MAVLGYDTQGALSTDDANLYVATHGTTDGTGGNTATIHAYVKNLNGSTAKNLYMTMYDDDGSDDPDNMLASQVTISVPASYDGEISTAYVTSLSASTKYWVAWTGEDSDIEVYYDSGAGANIMAFQAGATTVFPDPWASDSNFTNRFSIWVEYSAAPTGNIAVLRRRMEDAA